MIKSLKELKYRSNFGFGLANLFHKTYIFIFYRILSNAFYIRRKFYKVFGKYPDLIKPQTLNEKIQWYKLNYRHPLVQQCADKFTVRKYVADRIGEEHLIPLIYHTTNPKEIKSGKLPDYPFIIKANHTAGTNHIVFDKNSVDWKRIRVDCRWWLNLNYYHRDKEWQYKDIKPRVVVEKLLLDENGNVPSDFKLHFIDGNFEFLQVDLDRFSKHKRNLYDKEWNLMPFTWSALDEEKNPLWSNGRDIKKPKNLEKLIALGGRLAEPFPYVRVDFYILNTKIYFGELTFHHGGGYEHFTPNKWDLHFGKKVPLIKNF